MFTDESIGQSFRSVVALTPPFAVWLGMVASMETVWSVICDLAVS